MSDIILIETTPVKPSKKYIGNVYVPLAILSIAAPLIAEGYRVKIIDQRIEPKWEKLLMDEIEKKPLCVGITALTGRQILYGIQASKIVETHSDIPVVWGGIHASLLPEQTVKNQYIDFVVQGEGEETFLELVHTLDEKRGNYRNIKGLWFKKNDSIIGNERRKFLDMNTLHRIPFDLVDMEKYPMDLPIPTSRGCSYRCSFCYNVAYNCREWRSMSVGKTIEDIKYYTSKYNRKSIVFRDDNFFQSLPRMREICSRIVSEKLDIKWTATCRVDIAYRMTDEDFKLLIESGFRRFAIGIESGSQKVLDTMKKDITIEQIMDVTKKAKSFGIPIIASFVAGDPSETQEDLNKTIDLITSLFEKDPRFYFSLDLLTPYPGTELYDRVLTTGFHFPNRLEEWSHFERLTSQFGSNLGKKHAIYGAKTHWISNKQKKTILSANRLALIARDGVQFARRLGKWRPSTFIVRWARYRWKHKIFGPVPELYLYRFLKNIVEATLIKVIKFLLKR